MERAGRPRSWPRRARPGQWDWPVDAPPAAIAELRARHEGGTGFPIAREALGSRVERMARSIYALDPEVDGRFDLVYVGSLLLHLRDPVGALERARAVCRGRSSAPTGSRRCSSSEPT